MEEFEGPEKKLEIHTAPEFGSLRALGLEFWNSIVNSARATILSKISSPICDAYLLSESSLFVYPHKLTMITCGQTTLVQSALKFLEHVPPQSVQFLCFERKNELRPDLQISHFSDDTNLLQQVLPGKSICLGEKSGHHISLFYHEKSYCPPADDTTLEVLMHDIGREALALFTRGPGQISKTQLQRDSSVHRIFNGFTVDDYLFDPVGYSLNAIKDTWYYTIHVTPNPKNSYVSFETNYHLFNKNGDRSLHRILDRLLEIFQPGAFNVLVFHKNPGFSSYNKKYLLKSRDSQPLSCGYQVEFHNYVREGSI